jgi:hypothetical protein
MNESLAKKRYAILRGFNWFLSILIFSGAALFLFNSGFTGIYSLLAGAFILALSGNYFGSAIAINPGLTTVLGYPVVIGKKLHITLIVTNSVLAIFGIIIIASCILTQQYLASISGILYLAVSGFNVVALTQEKA